MALFTHHILYTDYIRGTFYYDFKLIIHEKDKTLKQKC